MKDPTISEAVRRSWADPESRTRRLLAIREAAMRAPRRRRLSEAKKAYWRRWRERRTQHYETTV